MKKWVLIADADEQFRNELAAALNASEEFEVVGVAADGEEAIRIAQEKHPDILVLDLLLPEYDGISVLDMLPEKYPVCKTFVVTEFISSYIASALMARQVCALVKKPCPVQCVVERMKEEMLQEMAPVAENLPDLHRQVTAMIHNIGVPAHINGYQYLREAIMLAVADFERINNMTQCIYEPIAQANNKTAKQVQDAMRRAIEIAWDRGDLNILQSFFGYTVSNTKGKPTNSEFIAIVADRILLSNELALKGEANPVPPVPF